MRKLILLLFAILFIGIFAPLVSSINELWTIDGDRVYVDDANAFIQVKPHTLQGSGWVEVNFSSKNYTGNIDIAMGFDTDVHQPQRIQAYNPVNYTVDETYSCNGENQFFNITLSPNHFWCYNNITIANITTDQIELEFEHDFDSGNFALATANWTVEKTRLWQNITRTFPSQDFEYQGMNKWWFIQNFSIVQGQENVYRVFIKNTDAFNPVKRKYWIAFKPSVQTIQQAISSGTFYALDPWTEGLNVGLQTCMTFDESSGTNVPDVTDGEFNYTTKNMEDEDWQVGIIGNSLLFDGVNEYIEPAGDPNISLATNNGTISVWINASSSTEDYVAGLVNSGVNTGNWRILKQTADDKINFMITNGGQQNIVSDDSIALGHWVHIVVQWGSSGTRMYINGTLQASTNAITQAPSSDDFCIGGTKRDSSCTQAATLPFAGKIDKWMVWNRTISASEVGDVYNNHLASTCIVSFDTEYPQFSENFTIPVTNSTYAPGVNYFFNITITSTNGTVGLDYDGVNYTATNDSSAFGVKITDLPAGSALYNWWAYGNGTLNLFNQSSTNIYTIQKATSAGNLFLDGAESNLSVSQGANVNATGVLTVGVGDINLYQDNVLIKTGPSPLENITTFDTVGLFPVNMTYDGNQNYTTFNVAYFVNVIGILDFNMTINDGITFAFIPNATIVNGVFPPGQNATFGTFTAHNNYSFPIEIIGKLNETRPFLTMKTGNNSVYADSIALNETYQIIYFNLSADQINDIWLWVDYDNATESWFPRLSYRARQVI